MSAIPETSEKRTREHLVQADAPSSNPAAAGPSELTAWERLSFSIAHEIAAILLRLLGLRGLHRLGRLFGTVEWCINFKRRRRFGRALQFILPNLSSPDRRRHTREHFRQTRCDKLYYLVFDRIPRETALQSLTIRNQELLDEGLKRGQGVYLALCHHGPLHVAAMLMAIQGYKVAGVRDRQEGAMRRYVQDLYDRKYTEFRRMRVMYSNTYPREIYRCLQEGYVLGSAMDVSRVRDPNQSSHTVQVFGREQDFLTGPLRIAMRCRALVLQAFVLPGPDFCYELHIVDRLLDPDRPGDEEAIIGAAMSTYAGNVEQYVRSYPALLTRT